MRGRTNAVGSLWIAFGVLLILGGVAIVLTALTLVFGGAVFLIQGSQPEMGWSIAAGIGAVGICGFVMGLISIPAGLALRKGRHWARTAITIFSAINLINFPVGTGIGIYSLMVLFDPVARAEFSDALR